MIQSSCIEIFFWIIQLQDIQYIGTIKQDQIWRILCKKNYLLNVCLIVINYLQIYEKNIIAHT